jgi:hypothetical protein
MQPTFLHLARAILMAQNQLSAAADRVNAADWRRKTPAVRAKLADANAVWSAAKTDRDRACMAYRLALFRTGVYPVRASRLDDWEVIHHAGMYYSCHR